MKKNVIIRASAGSGKTYQLSNRFLQLIFDAPSVDATLDTILASTFTRKAAGEISDRILTKFADVALDSNQRNELGKALHYPKSANVETELRRRLAELARNLYRLRIGTLDSYFNKIASVFSLELGLPPGWTILDDTDFKRFIDEAAREIFEDSERNNAKDLMYLLQQGREDVAIVRDLAALAMNWLPLVHATATTPEVWEHDRELQELMRGMLDDEAVQEQLERLEALSEDDLPKTKGKPVKPVHDFVEARRKLIEVIHNRDWDVFLGPKLTFVQKVVPTLANEKAECKFSRSGTDVRAEAPVMFEVVRTLIRHARGYMVKVLIDKTTATRNLLRLVAEKLDAILIRERKFRFDDLTRKISCYDFSGRRETLDHRLNAETKHLLLDEFQDTSKPQWAVLEPLSRNIAQNANDTFFCVGDVKQAIYSWRGGVAAIFDTMEDTLNQVGAKIETESMDTTWRNAQPIIDTVNRVFGDVDRNEAVVAVSSQAGAAWKKRFNEHRTWNKADGYCVLEESLPSQDSEVSAKQAHLEYIVDRIAQLARIFEKRPKLDKGLGVLVFTNEVAGQIVSELKKRNIEATGGGGSLADSVAVQPILSAMILADHPGNSIAAFHLAHSPLAATLEIERYNQPFQRAACSHRIRRDLATKGYGEVVRGFVEVLAPSCDPLEFQRLEKLLELAYRFDEEASGIRTQAFIAKVENESAVKPGSANIHVMTLHKAKGLEFDVVVLPHLDRDIKGEEPEIVVGYENPNDATSPINFVLRYVNKELQPLLPGDYKKVFERRIQGEVEESLSELYVALTRAIRQLVMIVPPRQGGNVGKTLEGILRTGLDRCEKENILYENGNANWYETIPQTDDHVVLPDFEELDCRLADKKVFHHVPRIVPSSLHQRVERSAASPMPNRSRADALAWGTAIHACFEQAVVWLDETPNRLDDTALRRIVTESLQGRRVSFSPEEVVAKFHEACGQPEVIEALSRSRYPASKVDWPEQERRFAVWIDGKIMHGSIDRLVVSRNEAGKITAVEILDYKSDLGDVPALVAAYSGQLNAYKKGIAALYKIDPKNVTATLVFVTLGRVEKV